MSKEIKDKEVSAGGEKLIYQKSEYEFPINISFKIDDTPIDLEVIINYATIDNNETEFINARINGSSESSSFESFKEEVRKQISTLDIVKGLELNDLGFKESIVTYICDSVVEELDRESIYFED